MRVYRCGCSDVGAAPRPLTARQCWRSLDVALMPHHPRATGGPLAGFLAVPCAAALVPVAGVAGLIGALPALAAGMAVTAAWAFVVLAGTAVTPRLESRGAGLLAFAALCTGLTAVSPLVVHDRLTPAMTIGQGLSALCFVL